MGKNAKFLIVSFVVILTVFSCFFQQKALAFSIESRSNQEVSFSCQSLLESSEPTSKIPSNPNANIRSACNNVKSLGDFAWKTFIALNWPADNKGNPLDRQLQQEEQAPRVWESYQTPSDIFFSAGSERTTRSLKPRLNEAAGVLADVTEFNEKGDSGILLASRKPLIDQNGNYTLNEIRINPVEVRQIRDNHWDSADAFRKQGYNNIVKQSQENFNPFALVCSDAGETDSSSLDGIRGKYKYKEVFPCRQNDGVGAIEIKAAWMIIPPGKRNIMASDYYTTRRTFFVDRETSVDGTSKDVSLDVALVGFHIVHKTSQGVGGWIWSTFENVRNAPDEGNTPSPEYRYSFYNPECEGKYCAKNVAHARDPYCWSNNFPYAVTRQFGGRCNEEGTIEQQPPSQITRLLPIDDEIQYLNSKIWQPRLKEKNSVWQNYQLIGVQWVDPPDKPYDDVRVIRPQPNLVNVTLEPYVQNLQIDPTGTGRSCIACHTRAYLPNSGAVHSDFSFLFQELKHPSK